MLSRSRYIFLVAAAFLSWAASAGEIDSFTPRYLLQTDATTIIDRKTDELLAEAVVFANGGPDAADRELFDTDYAPACDTAVLYNSIRERLGRRFIGQLQVYVLHHPDIEKSVLSRKTSIYRDFRLIETPTLGIGQRGSPVVRMGEFIIGTDKLGHFFAEGFDYFKRAYLRNKGVDPALRYGELTERLFFGGTMTGVYSYADLVANFNGMRFWTHLTGHYPDALQQSPPGPYVECRDNQWVKVRPFSWRYYIDAAWDEGINCSVFRNESLARRVRVRIRELERTTAHRMRCPTRSDVRATLRSKYGQFFARLINLDGHRSIHDHVAGNNTDK